MMAEKSEEYMYFPELHALFMGLLYTYRRMLGWEWVFL